MEMEPDTGLPLHLPAHPACGACGFAYDRQDGIIALLQPHGSESRRILCGLSYDGKNICTINDDCYSPTFRFCFMPCQDCWWAAAATFHVDCYKLSCRQIAAESCSDQYEKATATSNILWTAATWRTPWTGAPYLNLRPKPDMTEGLRRASVGLDMPLLAEVPVEIAEMIYEESRDSLLWKLSSAAGHVARWLGRQEEVGESIVPMDRLARWHEGESPKTIDTEAPSEDLDSVLIILDARGLRSIEQTSSTHIRRESAEDFGYVVEPIESFAGAEVHFLAGAARLKFQVQIPALRIWNTPNPPVLESWLSFEYDTPYSSRLRSLSLHGCVGITFFRVTSYMLDIHVHTKDQPSATSTFKAMRPEHHDDAIWMYIPLPQGLSTLGICGPRSIPAFMSDLRVRPNNGIEDIYIGYSYLYSNAELRETQNPEAIVLGGESVVYGILPQPPTIKQMPNPRPIAFDDEPFPRPYMLRAPLEDVANLKIFHVGQSERCRGILLEYNNGSQRAVGQCRIGVDPYELVYLPERLCYQNPQRSHILSVGLKVEAGSIEHHLHSDSRWTCRAMKGEVKFWFDAGNSAVEVLNT